uniref:Glycine N-acyltransferase-like protein n=1 Tax=Laticauda laticaudata TaxID=8630 RepID=A0A8C5SJY6_LATLA
MLVLSCPYKLRLLEGMLRKSLPQAIVVHGAVMNINRGNPIHHEVIVDSWPEFKVVLTRPCKEVINSLGDSERGRERRKEERIFSQPKGQSKILLDAAAAKQKKLSVIPYFLLEPGFRLSSLNSSSIDLLNENWAYGRNQQSRRYLAKMIQHFPGSGILNEEGYLISWMLMDLFGTQAHGYTLPSFRGKGYLAITTKALCMQAYNAGYPLYGFVVLKNNHMQRALEKGGYQKVSELSYLCFHDTT